MGKDISTCEQAITCAVSETLENMVFMEVFRSPEEASPPADEPCLAASLLIHDPLQGELDLIMPKELAKRISQAIYALPEEGLTEQIINDTFAELFNVIVGRFMNELLPKEQLYRLGLPEINETDTRDAETPQKEWLFITDGMTFLIRVVGKALLRG